MTDNDVERQRYNSSNVPAEQETDTFTRRDHCLCRITFFTSGMLSLFVWNTIVNCFVSAQRHIWPGRIFSNILGTTEYVVALAVACYIFGFVKGVSLKLLYASIAFNALCIVGVPLTVQLFPGEKNYAIAVPLLALCTALAGISSGTNNSMGYTLAAICPKTYVGFVSAGNGAAGAFTFLSFLILYEVCPKTVEGQQLLFWLFICGCGALLILIHIILLYILTRRPWFQNCVANSRRNYSPTETVAIVAANSSDTYGTVGRMQSDDDSKAGESNCGAGTGLNSRSANEHVEAVLRNESENSETLIKIEAKNNGIASQRHSHFGSRSDSSNFTERIRLFRSVLKQENTLHSFGAALTVVGTLFIFPVLGPYSWNRTARETTILNGTFQVCNFFGRLATGSIAAIAPPQWTLKYLVIWRLAVFIPLFYYLQYTNVGFGGPWAVMFFFTIFHAWIVTLCCLAATKALPSAKETSIASKLLVVCMLAGHALGVLASTAWS